jgi:2-polyprenyl-3-methyl-5-hydroxy-6-metoxy-1,4-benzoquinol methylase
MECAICSARMRQSASGWRFDCPQCGFLASTLAPSIGVDAATIDEAEREHALVGIRHRSFAHLLDRLESTAPPDQRRLLDVGCAHGWFLDLARERGYRVKGIEPDAAIADIARAKGHDVVTGFFPQDLRPDERFDVIVFNDVFEHLPDPRAVLRATRERLSDGGQLLLNLPSSRGIVYRVAHVLHGAGVRGPHDRLWQAGLPSPHLSYFHPDCLARLVAGESFDETERGTLPLYDVPTLWSRLRFARGTSLPVAAATWLALASMSPFLRWLPADISYQIFRVRPTPRRPAQ